MAGFKKASNGMRPNFMAVGGYDGMHLIYEGLKKTNGQGGEALVSAMKGLSWTSPRGRSRSTRRPASCRTSTCARSSGSAASSTTWSSPIPNVKDPVKAAKSN